MFLFNRELAAYGLTATQRRAWYVYLFSNMGVAIAFGLIFTPLTLFYIQNSGFNPLQLVLLGTALEGSLFVFEIPTGVVADIVSRRLSVLIGLGLLSLIHLIECFFPVFLIQVLLQVVTGLGYTFLSGAWTAWITDEVGEAAAAQAFLREAQLIPVGGLIGMLGILLLGSTSPIIPIIAGGVVLALTTVLSALTMPEQGFKPTPKAERSTVQHMADTLTSGLGVVKRSYILQILIALSFLIGMFSESYDRISELHFLRTIGLPVTMQPIHWFTVLGIFAMLLNILAAEVIRRRASQEQQQVARLLWWIDALLIGSALLFALSQQPWLATLAVILIGVLRHIRWPLLTIWMNQHIDSSVRATVFSISSQANAMGEIAGGPILGAVGLTSTRLALSLGALLLVPALWLYRRTQRQVVGQPKPMSMAEASEVLNQ